MTHKILPFVLFCFVTAFHGSAAQGGIIVSFGPSDPNPLIAGSSGLLDVFARTDVGSVMLDFFQVEVSLSGPADGLVFDDPQGETQLTDPDYVFFNVSSSLINLLPVGTVTDFGSIYTGSDATDDGAGMPAPVTLSTTNKLLYRLSLTALTAGSYDISVNAVNTAFSDGVPNSMPIELDPSTPGNITVSAVPEPSSLAVFAVVSGLGVYRIRRCRTKA